RDRRGGQGLRLRDRRGEQRTGRGRCRARRGAREGTARAFRRGPATPPADERADALMHFARVVGTVVCTVKVPSWIGHRLLMVEPTDPQGAPSGRPLVAIDLVSARPAPLVF